MSTNFHTPVATNAPANASTINAPDGQLDDAITKLSNGTTAITPTITKLNVSTDTTLTIASGSVTAGRARHLIDTEGAAAADDLDTINGGSEGDILVLRSVSAARVPTLRHGTGNLRLFGSADNAMRSPTIPAILEHDGTNWNQLVGRNAIGCKVYNDAAITLTTATLTPLTFNTERYDLGGLHSLALNTGRITIVVPGLYDIGGMARFVANATGIRLLYIRLNGARFLAEERRTPVSGDVTAITVKGEEYLAAGDYLELVAYQTSGGNLDVGISSPNVFPEFWASLKGF